MGFLGFNNKSIKRGTLGGDFDGDGVKNRKDCEPLNWKKQGAGHKSKEYLENESIAEYRRRVYPGMEKPWSKEEAEEHKQMKKRLSEAVDNMNRKRRLNQ